METQVGIFLLSSVAVLVQMFSIKDDRKRSFVFIDPSVPANASKSLSLVKKSQLEAVSKSSYLLGCILGL